MGLPVLKIRWWHGLFLLLLAIAVGGYFLSLKLPSLVEARLRKELVAFGVDHFQIGEPYWGLTGAGTRHLNATGRYENWQFQLQIDAFQADYHWRSLLGGEIGQVSLAALRLQLKQVAPPVDGPSAIIDFRVLERQLAALTLPVERIHIEALDSVIQLATGDLKVKGSGIAILTAEKAISGHLQLDANVGSDNKMELQLGLSPSEAMPWVPDLTYAVEIDQTAVGSGSLAIETMGPPVIRLVSHLNHARVDQLLAVLPQIPGQPKLPMAARLHVESEIRLPEVLDPNQQQWWHTIDVDTAVTGDIASEAMPQFGLTNLESRFQVVFAKSGDRVELSFMEPLTGQADVDLTGLPDMLADFGLADSETLSLEAMPSQPVRFVMARDGAALLQAGPLSVSARIGEHNHLTLNVEALEYGKALAVDLSGVAELRYGRNRLPALPFQSRVTGDGDRFDSNTKLELADLRIQGTLAASYTPAEIKLDGKLKMEDLAKGITFGESLGVEFKDLQLASGEATVAVQVNKKASSPMWPVTLSIQAREISGLYSGLAVSDMTVKGGFEKRRTWRSVSPMIIDVPAASAGVEISHLNANIALLNSDDFSTSSWRIERFKADVFSGEVSLAAPAVVELPFSGNSLQIVLSNLDLKAILALYAAQGVSGTGRLSGQIPIVLEREGVRVDKGRLYSLETGKIRFRRSGVADVGNPQLAMTLRLLEDFSYELLDVTAQFEPDGQLLLSARLSGNNPAEFDGRQVNFNINLEENVLDLYKVLTLSDKLTRQLEKKIQGN
jgi:Dicarboxylate transport